MTKRFGFEIQSSFLGCGDYHSDFCRCKTIQVAKAYDGAVGYLDDIKNAIAYTTCRVGYRDELEAVSFKIAEELKNVGWKVRTIEKYVFDCKNTISYGLSGAAESFLVIKVDSMVWWLNLRTRELKDTLDLEAVVKALDNRNTTRISDKIFDIIYMAVMKSLDDIYTVITPLNKAISNKDTYIMSELIKEVKEHYGLSDDTIVSLVKDGSLADIFTSSRWNEVKYSEEAKKEIVDLMVDALKAIGIVAEDTTVVAKKEAEPVKKEVTVETVKNVGVKEMKDMREVVNSHLNRWYGEHENGKDFMRLEGVTEEVVIHNFETLLRVWDKAKEDAPDKAIVWLKGTSEGRELVQYTWRVDNDEDDFSYQLFYNMMHEMLTMWGAYNFEESDFRVIPLDFYEFLSNKYNGSYYEEDYPVYKDQFGYVEASDETETNTTEIVKEMINDKNLLIGAGIPSETAQMMLEYATMGEGMRDWFKIGDVDVCNRVSFSKSIYDDGFCEVIKIHELTPYEEDDVITGWDNIREAIEYYDGKYKEYKYAFKEIASRIEDDGDLPESVSFIDKKLIRLRSGQVFPVVEIDGKTWFFVPEVYGVTWSDEPLTSDRVKIEVEYLLDWIRSDIADSIAYGVLDESGQEIDLFGEDDSVTEDETVVSPQKVIIGDEPLSISRFDDQIMVDKYHKPLGMLAEMSGACGIALIDKDPISGDDIKGVVSCEDPMEAYQLIAEEKISHIKFLSAWEMQKWEELDDSLQERIKAESPICFYDETLDGHIDFCKEKGGFVRSIEECIDFEPIPEASSYEWSLLEGIIGEHITRGEILKNEYYKDLIVSKLEEIKRVFGGWSNMVSDLRSLVLSN